MKNSCCFKWCLWSEYSIVTVITCSYAFTISSVIFKQKLSWELHWRKVYLEKVWFLVFLYGLLEKLGGLLKCSDHCISFAGRHQINITTFYCFCFLIWSLYSFFYFACCCCHNTQVNDPLSTGMTWIYI